MLVRYIGNTIEDEFYIKLVKNGLYNSTSCDLERNSINIEGIGSAQNLYNFETLDGNKIDYVDYTPGIEHVSEWGTDRLDEGGLLLCIAKNLKTLTYGKVYTLKDDTLPEEWLVSLVETKSKRRYGRNHFKKLSKQYIRDMKLKDLLEEESSIDKERFIHDGKPIINTEGKNELLFKLLLKAITHIDYMNVKEISIIDIMKEIGHPLLNMSDLVNFENINFKELLNKK